MTTKRFTETISTGIVTDNVTGKEYKCEMRIDDDLLGVMNALHEEKEHYKLMFFEIVETALTDKNCRELYSKGILDIFEDCKDLTEAKNKIKENLE